MNKSELAERLAGRTGMSRAAAKDAVDGVFDVIAELWRMAKTCGLSDSEPSAPGRARRVPPATRGREKMCRWRLRPCRSSSRADRSGTP